jgi:hypothetical protein
MGFNQLNKHRKTIPGSHRWSLCHCFCMKPTSVSIRAIWGLLVNPYKLCGYREESLDDGSPQRCETHTHIVVQSSCVLCVVTWLHNQHWCNGDLTIKHGELEIQSLGRSEELLPKLKHRGLLYIFTQLETPSLGSSTSWLSEVLLRTQNLFTTLCGVLGVVLAFTSTYYFHIAVMGYQRPKKKGSTRWTLLPVGVHGKKMVPWFPISIDTLW